MSGEKKPTPSTNIPLFRIKSRKHKSSRIKAKPWMFRRPFKVLWSSNNIKKLMVLKQNDFFSKIWNFVWKSSATNHIKYQRIDFAPCNKSIMENKLLSTNLDWFLRRIKSPLRRLKRELYRALLSQIGQNGQNGNV